MIFIFFLTILQNLSLSAEMQLLSNDTVCQQAQQQVGLQFMLLKDSQESSLTFYVVAVTVLHPGDHVRNECVDPASHRFDKGLGLCSAS